MRSFEDSLVRLGRQQVDILLAHDLGERTHGDQHPRHWRDFMEGGFKAMVELRDAGLVAALGLGANEWEVCAQALQYSDRSEEHTSELQSRGHLVCRLLLVKKKFNFILSFKPELTITIIKFY